jgi:hypothetical protein
MTMTLTPARRVTPQAQRSITPEVLAGQAGSYGHRAWVFSWKKEESMFHFRNGDLDLYIHSLAGYTFIREADGATGRMVLEHSMILDGAGHAVLSNPDVEADTACDAVDQQMCFNRSENKWRIWPKGDNASRLTVQSYYGGAYVYKPREDRGHIFASTPYRLLGGRVVFGG